MSQNTEKMTITRALAELKLLDSRIIKSINQATFCAYKKRSDKVVTKLNLTVEEFEKNVKSTTASIQALIERRDKIKDLVVLSNATTKVRICDKEYSVASAIERKNSIKYEKELLERMKRNLLDVKTQITMQDNKIEKTIDEMNLVYVGKDNKNSNSMMELNKAYRENNEYCMVDPISIQNTISKMTLDIENFETEVDFVLSESNSTTYIEL